VILLCNNKSPILVIASFKQVSKLYSPIRNIYYNRLNGGMFYSSVHLQNHM